MERQELLDREGRPDLRFIIGETALSRAVGGPDVMMHQLERVKELGKRPGISLQVLLFSAGAHPHMGGAFTILQFADENLDDLLYLEDASGERTIRDDEAVLQDYYETFAKLEGMATRPDDIADVLDKIAAQRFKDLATPTDSEPSSARN
jgi:hypothetical protein